MADADGDAANLLTDDVFDIFPAPGGPRAIPMRRVSGNSSVEVAAADSGEDGSESESDLTPLLRFV
jgi:hypothetical protein